MLTAMYPRAFYYSKLNAVLFFTFFLFLDCTLLYQFVLKAVGLKWWTYSIGTFIAGALPMSICFFTTLRIYSRWLLPALKNIPAFVVASNGIELGNSYPEMPWSAISEVKKKYARGGFVITIKLKDINGFVSTVPQRRRFELRLRMLLNSHFSIFTSNIEGDGNLIYDTINGFYDNYKRVNVS